MHIGFARTDIEVPRDVYGGALIGQPDADRNCGRIAVFEFAAVVISQVETTMVDHPAQNLVEQPHYTHPNFLSLTDNPRIGPLFRRHHARIENPLFSGA